MNEKLVVFVDDIISWIPINVGLPLPSVVPLPPVLTFWEVNFKSPILIWLVKDSRSPVDVLDCQGLLLSENALIFNILSSVEIGLTINTPGVFELNSGLKLNVLLLKESGSTLN